MAYETPTNRYEHDTKGIDAYSIEEEKLIADISDKYETSSKKMRDLHASWMLQQQFIAGNQNEFYDKDYKIRQFKKLSNYEEKEVRNKMRNYKNSYVARITQNKPMPFSKPITLKEEDVRSAKVTNAVIEDVWEKQDLEEKIDLLGEYLGSLGCGFIKVGWDVNAGDKVFSLVDTMVDKIQNNPMLDNKYKQALLNKIIYKKDIYQGDVFIKILSPYEIYIDNPTRMDIKECPWVIHSRVYDKDVVKLVYGLSDEDLPKEDASAITMQGRTNSYGLGYYNRGYSYTNEIIENSVSVIEYYERPSVKFPDGRFIVKVGKKIVHYDKLPYAIGENDRRDIPIIRVVATEELGNFYGATPIADLRGIQRDYNAVRNRTREAHNRKAIRQLVVTEKSLHESTELTNEPGNIIVVKSGKPKPEVLQDGIQTTEFFQEAQVIDKEFIDISGMYPFTQGNMPSQIRSAAQLSLLYESQDLNIGLPIKNMSKAIRTTFVYVIRLYKQFLRDNRFVKFQHSYEENIEWNKEIINENIYIKNVNSLTKSPAQQQQLLTDLINLGVFHEQNPYGMDNTIKMLELFGLGHMDAEVAIPHKEHRDKAKRENRRVINGKPIIVDEFDNHILHYKTHTDFIVSEDYEEFMIKLAAEKGLEFVQALEQMLREHIKIHQDKIRMQQAQMNAQMMAMQQKR